MDSLYHTILMAQINWPELAQRKQQNGQGLNLEHTRG